MLTPYVGYDSTHIAVDPDTHRAYLFTAEGFMGNSKFTDLADSSRLQNVIWLLIEFHPNSLCHFFMVVKPFGKYYRSHLTQFRRCIRNTKIWWPYLFLFHSNSLPYGRPPLAADFNWHPCPRAWWACWYRKVYGKESQSISRHLGSLVCPGATHSV